MVSGDDHHNTFLNFMSNLLSFSDLVNIEIEGGNCTFVDWKICWYVLLLVDDYMYLRDLLELQRDLVTASPFRSGIHSPCLHINTFRSWRDPQVDRAEGLTERTLAVQSFG